MTHYQIILDVFIGLFAFRTFQGLLNLVHKPLLAYTEKLKAQLEDNE